MNRPSSTITAATLAGGLVGLFFVLLAAFAPEYYERIQVYPGAEAHLTTLVAGLVGWRKRERVLEAQLRQKIDAERMVGPGA